MQIHKQTRYGSKLLGTLILLSSLAGCTKQQHTTQLQTGPAITFPHTVAKVASLELVLNNTNDQLSYTLRCTDSGSYDLVTVTITREPQGLNQSSAQSFAANCSTHGAQITVQPLASLATFKAGEHISVNLAAIARDGVSSEEGQVYIIGVNKQLHAALGTETTEAVQ